MKNNRILAYNKAKEIFNHDLEAVSGGKWGICHRLTHLPTGQQQSPDQTPETVFD